jgi:5'-deoxynucleotidase YfbR-like HD superfamily hydrolase
VITALEGGNPERAAFLSLFHDTQETRVTDIPYIGKRYVKAAPNEEVTADQVRGVPEPVEKQPQALLTSLLRRLPRNGFWPRVPSLGRSSAMPSGGDHPGSP